MAAGWRCDGVRWFTCLSILLLTVLVDRGSIGLHLLLCSGFHLSMAVGLAFPDGRSISPLPVF